METKPNPENQEKTGKIRKIVTILIVLVFFAVLALGSQYLVNNVDIVELLKKLHGG